MSKRLTLKYLSGCTALLALAGAKADEAEIKQKHLPEVQEITKTFAGELQKELLQAMQTGGPLNALSVCNTSAMPITAKVAADKHAKIRRVSLNNRNPENVPDDWQESILRSFDTRAANGEDITTMGVSKVVQHGSKKSLVFMKAVPTGGACLACHGSNIDVDLQQKITELYPNDKATGYTVGQVRGAIVIEKEIE